MSRPRRKLRLGTRGSALAVAQSRLIASELQCHHAGRLIELVIIKTTGDRVQDRPLHEIGGKGVFTKEIELAVLAGEVDCAVHSLKDMPVTMPLVDDSALTIAAVAMRGDATDTVVSVGARSIDDLSRGASVGTCSLRRRAQVLNRRADLKLSPLRGNVDSRLEKLRRGQFDAIIVATAGLQRLGVWDDSIMRVDEKFIPAAGQGALAVQCRGADAETVSILSVIDDAATRACVEAERELVRRLDGDCHSPIGVNARWLGASMKMRAAVGGRGGEPPVIGAASEASSPAEAVEALCGKLLEQGALEMLHGTTN